MINKVYAVKNKNGKYWCGNNDFASFKSRNINATFDYQIAERHAKKFDDCEVTILSICEGDLEEENRVLKKALELACEEIDNYWNCKEAYKKNQTLEEYFIQQAKESEKDDL